MLGDKFRGLVPGAVTGAARIGRPTIFASSMYHDVHEPLTLNHDRVDVWQVDLSASPEATEKLRRTLSSEERERADRYYFPENRTRFIVSRGALRSLLGSYLQVPPERIALVSSPFGKPSLDPAEHPSDLCFNLSHSGNLALCAFTRGREIGIDVEAVRQVPDADRIATRYFDTSENVSYQSLPPEARLEGFFIRWTLKEAYLKAHGQGLSIPLDSFTVTSASNAEGWHTVRSGNPEDDRQWRVVRLDTPPGFVAALVVRGHGWQLARHRWGCT